MVFKFEENNWFGSESRHKIAEIFDKTDQEQAEKIAEYFSSIPNEYNAIKDGDIEIQHFSENQIIQFHPSQVWLQL